MRRRPALVLAVAMACIAYAWSAMAGEPRRSIDASRALDAGAPPAAPDVTIAPIAPDPAPLVEKSDWVFDLRWDHGEVWLVGVHRLDLASAQATPRVMGRFALELFEGRALVERVRFDFPLLAAAPVDADAGLSLSQGLRTRIGVLFPATRRGTRLELCDRATHRRWALPWPPAEGPRSPSR